MDLPRQIKIQIGVADAIARLWPIWVPFTVLACLAVANAFT